ncbi:MAG TPA: hypothetical protein VKY73_05775 [Polyangiaceae bacterium]|nr:hypothetical protein [Polyangiaceae bacterium]
MNLQKLASRKFFVTLLTVTLTVFGALMGLDLQPYEKAIAGIVAVAYLLVEGTIDSKRASAVAEAIERGIALARETPAKGGAE